MAGLLWKLCCTSPRFLGVFIGALLSTIGIGQTTARFDTIAVTPNGDMYVLFDGLSSGIWMISDDGKRVILHSFLKDMSHGWSPVGFVLDSKGNLFGTCSAGGAHDQGTIWEISSGGSYTVLYSFNEARPGERGLRPNGIAVNEKGDLFGICSEGGPSGYGTVWELSTGGSFTTLHSFGVTKPDGKLPIGSLTIDREGNLFGTCYHGGGPGADGTLWEVIAGGGYKTVHTFGMADSDGKGPTCGACVDSKGNLFGTCEYGGLAGSGIVWEISLNGTEKILHEFGTHAPDCKAPYSIYLDQVGNIFGMAASDSHDCRTVWELSATKIFRILHSFESHDLAYGLAMNPQGDIFGTFGLDSHENITEGGTIWELPQYGTYKKLSPPQ